MRNGLQCLPLETRDRIDAERRDRHLALTECPWTTVSAALEAIEELLPDADDAGREILVEYQRYLEGLCAAGSIPPPRSMPHAVAYERGGGDVATMSVVERGPKAYEKRGWFSGSGSAGVHHRCVSPRHR